MCPVPHSLSTLRVGPVVGFTKSTVERDVRYSCCNLGISCPSVGIKCSFLSGNVCILMRWRMSHASPRAHIPCRTM